MTIDEEIQQSRWESPQQKAIINVLFTSRALETATAAALEIHGLTAAQFNILRIVRGQKGKPASIKLLVERMLDKSSNASRIVDRLVEKNLVHRIACPKDRRAVEVTLTAEGNALLSQIDTSGHAWSRLSPEFSDADAQALSQLLDHLRTSLSDKLHPNLISQKMSNQGENP